MKTDSARYLGAYVQPPHTILGVGRFQASICRKRQEYRERPGRTKKPYERTDQFIEHDPGPRGSPQVPHGPAKSFGAPEPPALTAKTDSCFSSAALAQAGQEGSCPCRVRYSKRWPQSRQANSNRGICSIKQ